jgi:hypothetical protein
LYAFLISPMRGLWAALCPVAIKNMKLHVTGKQVSYTAREKPLLTILISCYVIVVKCWWVKAHAPTSVVYLLQHKWNNLGRMLAAYIFRVSHWVGACQSLGNWSCISKVPHPVSNFVWFRLSWPDTSIVCSRLCRRNRNCDVVSPKWTTSPPFWKVTKIPPAAMGGPPTNRAHGKCSQIISVVGRGSCISR